jgi:hypothetical protein
LHVPIASAHGRDHQVHDLDVISNNNVVELSDFQSDDPTFIPPCKKQKNEGKSKKNSCDNTCKFQIEWAIHMPWARGLVFKGGFINVVKCIMCSLIENKEKIIGCKWDTLTKHQHCRIVMRNMSKLGVKKGGEYIVHDCVHLKNMKLYA